MFAWAVTFLIIAIMAAVVGFGSMAGTAAGIVAKLIFLVFLILFAVFLATGRAGRPFKL